MTSQFAILPADGTIDLEDATRYRMSADGTNYEFTPEYLVAYRASVANQLEKWVAGTSVHNELHNECCPDFSCCSDSSWPMEMRKEFKDASEFNRRRMLLCGLKSTLVQSGTEVYVAGEDSPVTFH